LVGGWYLRTEYWDSRHHEKGNLKLHPAMALCMMALRLFFEDMIFSEDVKSITHVRLRNTLFYRIAVI